MNDTISFFTENGYGIAMALVAIISSIASLITMFIDESKVNKYIKPVIAVLNFAALNIFKNKNATDK
jgi:hypothetical protein